MTFFHPQVFAAILTSCGPLGVLFIALLLRKPAYIVVGMVGMFTWMSAAILSGVLWRAAWPLAFFAAWPLLLTFSLVSLSRWLLCHLWLRLHAPPRGPSPHYPHHHVAAGLGWGYALAQVLTTQSALWADSAGPGSLMSTSCSGMSALALSSLLASAMALAQVCVFVLFMDGFVRRSLFRCLLPLALYLSASSASLLNALPGDSLCVVPLLVAALVLSLLAALTCCALFKDPPPPPLTVLPSSWSLSIRDWYPLQVFLNRHAHSNRSLR